MKMSVSVPDELWEAARSAVDGRDSPSAVVQEGLSRLVEVEGRAKPYAAKPAMEGEVAAQAAAARARLLAGARELYQKGYREGIKIATELTVQQLQMLVRVGVAKATENAVEAVRLDQRYPDPGGRVKEPLMPLGMLVGYLGSIADPRDVTDWAPNELLLEGMDQAFRDLWDDVRADTSAAPAGNSRQDAGVGQDE